MVALNIGKGRKDATCAAHGMSLPHIDVQTTPGGSERFFSSGNERTPFDYSKNKVKAGYRVKQGDKFSFIVDLMNMNMEDKKVYMTITYEYQKGTPKGYKAVRPIWLDIDQCGLSDVSATNNKAYTKTARPWRSTFSGQPVLMGGHLHDGGTKLEITQNGKIVCESTASYGATSRYIGGADHQKHISGMKRCGNDPDTPLAPLKVGDVIGLKAHYDYTVHKGMNKDNGKPSDVMGIGIIWVAVPVVKDLL